jgi:hypothetical protein
MVSFNPQVSPVVVNNHISVKAATEFSGYRPPAPDAIVVTPTQFQDVGLTSWVDLIVGAAQVIGRNQVTSCLSLGTRLESGISFQSWSQKISTCYWMPKSFSTYESQMSVFTMPGTLMNSLSGLAEVDIVRIPECQFHVQGMVQIEEKISLF